MKKLVFFLILIILFQSCKNKVRHEIGTLKIESNIIESKDTIYDIAYGELPRQKLNAFFPTNRNKNTKAIILIHGGAWVAGDKKNFEYIASQFANDSIAAFTINYQYANLKEGITYIEMLDDIEKAIQFLNTKSEEYVFDSNKLCLFGHSAGAHLALLYTYRNNKSNQVSKVISLAGPVDLTDSLLVDTKQDRDLLNILVGNLKTHKIKDASPIYFANKITTYLYHGMLDTIVPYQQSKNLFKKIKKLNTKNRLVLFENDNHGFNYDNWMTIVKETVALIKEK